MNAQKNYISCYSINYYFILIKKMNTEKQHTQSQAASDRSYVNLGLMLTQKLLNQKTKLKEFNPTLIYQWDGQTMNNQVSGKGTFRVRNSLTNQIVYQCEVKKWKNNLPQGNIVMKKINFFSNSEISDYKMKQIQTYQGGSQNLKKHGKGTYIFQEFYSSGKVKKSTIYGEWNQDILVQGVLENEYGKKQLNLSKNVEWSKSTKSIVLDTNQIHSNVNIGGNNLVNNNFLGTNVTVKEQKSKDDMPRVAFKQSTNTLLPEPPVYNHKYLDPVKLR